MRIITESMIEFWYIFDTIWVYFIFREVYMFKTFEEAKNFIMQNDVKMIDFKMIDPRRAFQ